ncbi:hypothetical protein TPHA_0A03930 [Tetrapisispora phaffii CBS 4417]|uniref:VLRF1 domain-containing protein n=1 Tax=Tetrapisispora phaffii (strain ATCC 24235 / CBS 4417 / NBRC 1672 / NRRL Y-8282 / UCD 70-5) TaxID=1071381 RepID=G8BNJ1_TETPH|nr:hypothetical protein TPHA_0A03930 [Tetrapisispora phaffii CBS 4417]CCE61469.1 hypothetical protein TPHA_0A03930 [Tetrapisispora phaffii CBS 4417]
MSKQNIFKKNDLYIYDLSPLIINSLKLVNFDSNLNEVELPDAQNEANEPEQLSQETKLKEISNSLTCNTCDLEFNDQKIKREHYRTDFHIFNVKRKVNGLDPLSEINYSNLTDLNDDFKKDEAMDTIDEVGKTTDENSSSEEEPIGSDTDMYAETLSTLDINIKNETQKLEDEILEQAVTVSHLNTRSAQIYFNSDILTGAREAFGAYKTLFNEKELEIPLDTVKAWNDGDSQSTAISALFMVSGGHFAGAIVSHQKLNVKRNSKNTEETIQEQAVSFLEKKTFHRYTTRRKQGGSQSANDNAKGKANSAGSTLRRYNEFALREDIQNLLKEWNPYLQKCQNIFIRANSVFDKKTFMDSDYISKEDDRIKTFPFPTNKPALHELKKAWCELVYLKVSEKPKPSETKIKLTDNSSALKNNDNNSQKTEIKLEEQQTKEALSLLKKGRAPLLIAFLRKNKLNANFILEPKNRYENTPTLLHFASQQGFKQMVGILSTTLKADLSIKNKFGKTPYELAKNNSIKQAFQIARFNLGESYTSWQDTKIGGALSREQVDEMNKEEETIKNEELRNAIEEELQKQKEKRDKELEEKRGVGCTLGNNEVDFSVKQNLNLNSLNEDQRKRLMREQRARAAEARIKAMQNK